MEQVDGELMSDDDDDDDDDDDEDDDEDEMQKLQILSWQ